MGRAHVVSMMSECVRVPFSEVALSASFVITKDFLPVIEQFCSSYSEFFFFCTTHYPTTPLLCRATDIFFLSTSCSARIPPMMMVLYGDNVCNTRCVRMCSSDSNHIYTWHFIWHATSYTCSFPSHCLSIAAVAVASFLVALGSATTLREMEISRQNWTEIRKLTNFVLNRLQSKSKRCCLLC